MLKRVVSLFIAALFIAGALAAAVFAEGKTGAESTGLPSRYGGRYQRGRRGRLPRPRQDDEVSVRKSDNGESRGARYERRRVVHGKGPFASVEAPLGRKRDDKLKNIPGGAAPDRTAPPGFYLSTQKY